MSTQRALALIGSPRAKSTSARLAEPLLAGLAEVGWETEQLWLPRALRNPERWAELVAAYEQADLVVFACPLYVDALPGETTVALERLAADAGPGAEGRGFVAILNCGFAEPGHNDTALRICRQFAREAGLRWLGGLAVGGGGMIEGRPLATLGGRAAHLVRALEQAAEALSGGGAIPPETERLARRLSVPVWAYRMLANYGMKQAARKAGCLAQVRARPYARGH